MCAKIKRDLKKEFKTGKIKATDVGDEKGFEIVTQLGLQENPGVRGGACRRIPRDVYNRRVKWQRQTLIQDLRFSRLW